MCVQRKTNAFLDVYGRLGSFRKFRRDITCYNWALSDAVVSPSRLQICFTIISVTILHKCDETSLTVTRIAVSVTLSEKWP